MVQEDEGYTIVTPWVSETICKLEDSRSTFDIKVTPRRNRLDNQQVFDGLLREETDLNLSVGVRNRCAYVNI